MDREDGGILKLRASAGKDHDGTGWVPRVRVCAKVPPPELHGPPEQPGSKD